MKKIFFIGAGGHFRDVYNWYLDQMIYQKKKNEIKGIIDDYKEHLKIEKSAKLKIYKSNKITLKDDIYLILSIGQIQIRKKVIKKFRNFKFENCIHPRAVISPGSSYKKGNIFAPNAIISGNAKIGEFNNFSQNSTLSHDCKVGNNNFFSPGASIMGNCNIGNDNFFGVSSNMLPGVKIINDNVIGANATMIKSSLKTNKIFIGIPAKEKK